MLKNLVPVYPRAIFEQPDEDEMMRVSRNLVKLEYGRYALGPVKKDSQILIVVPMGQDEKILETIKRCLKEAGAAEVDVISEKDVARWQTTPTFSADRGWDELAFFPARFGYRHFLEDSDAEDDIQENDYDVRESLRGYVAKLQKNYDAIFAGVGGWTHYKSIVGGPYKSLWVYTSYEYARLFSDFPAPVWNAVEDRIKSIMPNVEEVKVTDEEGTNLLFTIDEEQARLWAEESQPSNHLFVYPRPPSFPEANGVIAGTSNHYGFYPRVEVTVRHGLVEKIEGGGKFGDLWREYQDRYRDAKYPGFPSPGYYYIHESALATNPRGFRHNRELFNTPILMPNDSERNRAGVIHWGFGLQALDFVERKTKFTNEFDNVMKFAKEKDMPYCHSAHIHNYFITYEVRLRGTKDWIRLVDKGRLTSFDDEKMREIASQFGNPEEIFRYDWIPAIPGITYRGSYAKDYADDPISWVKKEIDEIIPRSGTNVPEEVGASVKPHLHEHHP